MEVSHLRNSRFATSPRPSFFNPRRRLQKHDIETALRKNLRPTKIKLMDGGAHIRLHFIFRIGKLLTQREGWSTPIPLIISPPALASQHSAHDSSNLLTSAHRPASLEPLDHTREIYTRALVVREGVNPPSASYTPRPHASEQNKIPAGPEPAITDLQSRRENWQAPSNPAGRLAEKYSPTTTPRTFLLPKGQCLAFCSTSSCSIAR